MERLAANESNSRGQRLPTGDFAIAALAARQDGLIASWQLLTLGLNRKSISYRVGVGRLYPIYPGVYAVGTPTLTPRGHLRAALLHHGPSAILSHRSAAAHWGIRATAQSSVDVMVPGSSRRKRPGIAVHRARHLDPADTTTHDGMPITSLPRTLLDVAAVLTRPHLLRALEQADRLELLNLTALNQVCDRYPLHRGRRQLDSVVTDLREPPSTRSELERRFLDMIRLAGLPEPLINAHVAGFEVDFYWPEHRLVVELDGFAYHRHRAAFEARQTQEHSPPASRPADNPADPPSPQRSSSGDR